MRPIQCLAFAAAVLLLAGVAVAEDEIVHFTNGTSMAVRSHTVEGGMVKVDLGKESYMAFPLVMVEKITKAGRELDLTGGPSNRAVGSDAGGSGGGGPRVLSAEGQVPARYRAGRTTRGSMDQETLDKLNRALGIEEGGTVTVRGRRIRRCDR